MGNPHTRCRHPPGRPACARVFSPHFIYLFIFKFKTVTWTVSPRYLDSFTPRQLHHVQKCFIMSKMLHVRGGIFCSTPHISDLIFAPCFCSKAHQKNKKINKIPLWFCFASNFCHSPSCSCCVTNF